MNKIITLKNGLNIKLNDQDYSAQIIQSQAVDSNIFIPNSVFYESNEYKITDLDDRSFNYNQIKSIIFPEDSNILIIGMAFSFSTIKSISFPASLVEFKEGWCQGLKNLTQISISPLNKNFCCINQQLIIGKSNSNSIEYDSLIFARRDIETIIIPSFIKYINSYAFENCQNLYSIEFAKDSQLTTIKKSAFAESGISNIVIPKHVKKIEDDAFYNCNKIVDFKFDEDSELESFGYGVFWLSSLKSITIPQHVKMLFSQMFEQCGYLNEICFNENSELTTFCNSFFSESPITTLYFPSKLETLEDGWSIWAFDLCNIVISPENKNFKYLDSNNKIILGKSDKNSTIFDVIMFACRDIESVVFPSYIKEIKNYAFANCAKLKTLDFTQCNDLEVIPEDAFSEIEVRDLVIPCGVHLIKDGAFIFARMESVEILGDNTITFQHESFQECKDLLIVSCPNADKLIVNNAFSYVSLFLFTCPKAVVKFNNN